MINKFMELRTKNYKRLEIIIELVHMERTMDKPVGQVLAEFEKYIEDVFKASKEKENDTVEIFTGMSFVEIDRHQNSLGQVFHVCDDNEDIRRLIRKMGGSALNLPQHVPMPTESADDAKILDMLRAIYRIHEKHGMKYFRQEKYSIRCIDDVFNSFWGCPEHLEGDFIVTSQPNYYHAIVNASGKYQFDGGGSPGVNAMPDAFEELKSFFGLESVENSWHTFVDGTKGQCWKITKYPSLAEIS